MRRLRRLAPDDRWVVYWPATLVGLVIAFSVLPGGWADYVVSVAVLGSVLAIGALGLNVQYGFTGLLNFGHVLSLMLGAYTTALLVLKADWNIFIAMLAGGIVAAIGGWILGLFSLRLRGDYLAIVTIAIAELVRIIIRNSGTFRVNPATGQQEYLGTGGTFGLQNFAGQFEDTLETLLPFIELRQWRLFVFFAVLITLLLALTWTLKRSPWGRAVRAIREDEAVASALGKSTFLMKLQSFAAGAFIGAFAGIAFALNANFTEPDTWLPIFTFRMWIAMMIGGAGTIFGPILGAFILQAIFSVVRFLPRIAETSAFSWIPDQALTSNRVFALEGMLLGALIALVVFVRPQGILGRREDLILDRT